jgi:DNA-binding NarL/FixJ family response regulator
MGERDRRARILVVDDDDPFRAYLCAALEDNGYAPLPVACGSDALAVIESDVPAAVILDVNLGGLSGYEVCRVIRDELRLDVPVLFVSGERTESFDRVAGLAMGADDYLAKPFAEDELLARLRSLLRRVPQANADRVVTPREFEVLKLLAEGMKQSEIAAELVISSKTVASHIERILGKLGAHSRAQAVAIAYRDGLVNVASLR